MRPGNKQKQAPLGCLFWIAFILLMFLLFFINKDRITNAVRSFQESGFFARMESPQPAQPLRPAPAESASGHESKRPLIEIISPTEEDARQTRVNVPPQEERRAPNIEDEAPAPSPALPSTLGEAAPAIAAPESPRHAQERQIEGRSPSSETAPAQQAAAPTRQQRLYFVSIDRDGTVVRQEVLKDIPRSNSPLADSITALFAGPTEAERQKGIISLIPAGTRLISAFVKDGVATLNISEEFRFSPFGVEGAIAQLAQVVFTATTFPTVDSVQILIEGQTLNYLGAEGVWIGTPLARKDFF